jgi:hypothetical protein
LYPYQRIEGCDTVVVMTKKQGDNINDIFKINKFTIDSLYNKNNLLINHILEYEKTLQKCVELNENLDSLIYSKYFIEKKQQIKKDKIITPILFSTWILIFLINL